MLVLGPDQHLKLYKQKWNKQPTLYNKILVSVLKLKLINLLALIKQNLQKDNYDSKKANQTCRIKKN